MQPFMFVGIGGTGGKTLRYIWRETDRRLRSVGWDRPYLPRCFGFLNIDLPSIYDGNTETDVPVITDLDAELYVGLGGRDVDYVTYDARLADNDRLRGFNRWRPWPPQQIAAPSRGAGQRRAVGRAVTVAQLPALVARITTSLDDLTGADAMADLDRLRELLPDGRSFEGNGSVFVVGSLAGGSGAGMALDVIEAIRFANTTFAGHVNPSSVLVAPDVFEMGISGPSHGLHGNALATLSELVNAVEHTGPLPAAELSLRLGVQPNHDARVGRNNFIVGRSNGEVSFRRPAEVYQAVGRLLSAIALSPSHQGPFDQYIDVNAMVTPLNRQLGSAGTVSSVGYAVVGLGRHLFRDYAAERLSHEVLERLLRGHEHGDPDVPSEVRLRRMLETRWDGGFAKSTGLIDLGEDDGILGTLRDYRDTGKRVQALKERFLSQLSKRGNEFDGPEWVRAHEGEYRSHATELEKAELERRNQAARDWTNTVQDRLVDLVVSEAAGYGLPVALGLVERLRDAVRTEAARLRRFADEKAEEENSYAKRATNALAGIMKRVGINAPEHDQSARYRASGMLMRLESESADLGARLLEDVAANLLPPLRRTLEGLLDELSVAERTEPTRTIIRRWTRGPLPPHLEPAPNEHLVEPATAFPRELEELLVALYPGSRPLDAIRDAATEIITGRWPALEGSEHVQTLVEPLATWEPREGQARWSDVAAASAAFEVNLPARDLPARATDWLTRRQGPVREYIAQNLADYLSEPAKASSNQANFIRALRLTLAQSRPFIEINPNVVSSLTGVNQMGGADTIASVSTIPLAEEPGSGLYDSIIQAISQAGIPSSSIRFDASSRAAEIDVIQYPSDKFHPAAFESLVASVRTAWQAARVNDGTRARFWDSRRARTLEAFVPLPGTRIDDLVRGFFVAVTFGQMPLSHGQPWSDEPRRLWTPTGWLPLPRYLLNPQGDVIRHNAHLLPALLESFPLTWLDVISESSLLPGYERLMALGSVAGGACHDEIVAWIENTELPATAPGLPEEPKVQALGGSAAERRTALVERFTHVAEQWSALDITGGGPRTPPRDVLAAAEIGDRVTEALGELITAVRNVSVEHDPTGEGGRAFAPSGPDV